MSPQTADVPNATLDSRNARGSLPAFRRPPRSSSPSRSASRLRRRLHAGPGERRAGQRAVYVEATLHPHGDEQADAKAVLGKLLHTADPARKLQAMFDRSLRRSGERLT